MKGSRQYTAFLASPLTVSYTRPSIGQHLTGVVRTLPEDTARPQVDNDYIYFPTDSDIRRAQELCESRGGRPGLPSLISLRFLWT